MRNLPHKLNKRQKLIAEVVKDYFGPNEKQNIITRFGLYLMGRRKDIEIKDEEMADIERIKENLKDKTYLQSFQGEI